MVCQLEEVHSVLLFSPEHPDVTHEIRGGIPARQVSILSSHQYNENEGFLYDVIIS